MRHLYTPAVMQKIFSQASAAALQSVDEINMAERNAIEIYVEYTTATSIALVPWVRLKAKHNDGNAEAWAQLPSVTIPKVTDTASPPGNAVLGSGKTRSALVVVSVPNCFALKLELTTITGGGSVTVWAAPIEKPPAIA